MKKHSKEWLEARPFVTTVIALLIYLRFGHTIDGCFTMALMWVTRLEQEWPDN